MKRVLFLGASSQQIPPIIYAKEKGYYVVTADNVKGNPGHQFADESHHVSTTDMEGILLLAKQARIDGIVAYASDPAAPTAAFVAEKLSLPGNPFESVRILSNKSLWRRFLKQNGFHVPKFRRITAIEELQESAQDFMFPMFLKPVDSSGSKGITRLLDGDDLPCAFNEAKKFSRCGDLIVEEEIVVESPQIAGDGFVLDGVLEYYCWADENFNKRCNGVVPIGQTFPTRLEFERQSEAEQETQRVLQLLGIKVGALNFDFVFDIRGRFHFLELGPRNGGCRIPEVIKYHTGLDFISMTVDAALGISPETGLELKPDGYWASYMIHSESTGTFKEVRYRNQISDFIVESELWVSAGDPVYRYSGSNCILGSCIMNFPSRNVMEDFFHNPLDFVSVDLR
jgi:biotin carboxylase